MNDIEIDNNERHHADDRMAKYFQLQKMQAHIVTETMEHMRGGYTVT